MSRTYYTPIFLLLIVGFFFFNPLFATHSEDLKKLPMGAQQALEKVVEGQEIKSVVPLQGEDSGASLYKVVLKGQGIESVAPLLGGYSGASLYKIITPEKSYVLRLIDPHRDLADREQQIQCMQIASARNIAPQVYYANAKDGVIVMEFIQTVPLSEKDRSPKILLPRLSHILRRLHESPAFPPTSSTQEEIRHMVSELTARDIKLPPLIHLVLKGLPQIEIPLQKTAKLSPCHNDLNIGNILFTQKEIKVIDWDDAGMGDPYLDIATIAFFFAFSSEDEDILLKSYFGASPTAYQRDRFYLMKQLTLYYYGLKALKNSLSKKEPFLFAKEIKELPDVHSFMMSVGEGRIKLDSPLVMQRMAFVAFKQAFKNMQTKEFTAALAHITSTIPNTISTAPNQ